MTRITPSPFHHFSARPKLNVYQSIFLRKMFILCHVGLNILILVGSCQCWVHVCSSEFLYAIMTISACCGLHYFLVHSITHENDITSLSNCSEPLNRIWEKETNEKIYGKLAGTWCSSMKLQLYKMNNSVSNSIGQVVFR